ncbi:MAG: VOC family protein [Ignavibacteriae bacterium]|nr:MAG: VOC family protein [Ignavibacteriota bacterium]
MHAFGHIEIPTTNLENAKKFFGAVFGWTFSYIPEIDYTLLHTGKHPNGGFEIVKRLPKKGQVSIYIETGDIDSTLKAVRKARGKVLMKKTPVGTMGSRARFATPEGVEFCLWQPAPRMV